MNINYGCARLSLPLRRVQPSPSRLEGLRHRPSSVAVSCALVWFCSCARVPGRKSGRASTFRSIRISPRNRRSPHLDEAASGLDTEAYLWLPRPPPATASISAPYAHGVRCCDQPADSHCICSVCYVFASFVSMSWVFWQRRDALIRFQRTTIPTRRRPLAYYVLCMR